MSRLAGIWVGSLLILALFGGIVFGIQQQSFWLDEGWTAWSIRDPLQQTETLRQVARFFLMSQTETLERVRADVHPPLYFMFLDVWAMVAGISEFALRLPSALAGGLALAGMYSIGSQWFNRKVGVIALILVGTSGFFIYYGRDARMYPFFLAFATLSTWAYGRWWHKPTVWHGILYSSMMVLALYTHYVSALVILSQIIHRIVSRRSYSLTILLPYSLAGILFAPWLFILRQQIAAHPGGAAANFLPSDRNTLAAIWLLFTSGYWLNFVLPFFLGRALPNMGKKRIALSLVALWVLVPLALLWIINGRGFTILQMRYLIVLVPAWSMLIAYAIDQIDLSIFGTVWKKIRGEAPDHTRNSVGTQHNYASIVVRERHASPLRKILIYFLNTHKNMLHLATRTVQLFFVIWLAYTQASMFANLWPAKPRWRDAVTQAAATRTAQEPALIDIDPRSPTAYYDQFVQLVEGISINIGWRRFDPGEIRETAAYLDGASQAWAMLPMADPTSWDAIAALGAGRSVGYRDSVQGTIYYRFDREHDEPLNFRFGDSTPFEWDYQTFSVEAGESLCPELPTVDESTMIELALIRGYAEVVEHIQGETCITVPEREEPLYLRVALLDHNGARLPLTENDLYWGDFLFLGVIE